MSSIDTLKIKKLFQEERFSEIIFEIESLTSEKNRSPTLHNLLGVCRASQKGRSKRDIEHAFEDFETAFEKDNLGEISLEALCNHIKLCAEMGRRESDLINKMIIAEKMYLKAEKKFSDNERFILTGLDMYKYLLKHEERIKKVDQLINKKKLNKILGTIYIVTHLYTNKWGQKDFWEFQKKFTKVFKVYNAKKLSKIDINKKKIKVGFLSSDYLRSHSVTYFITNLIKDLKHTKFETHGLSLLKSNEHDETTEKFITLFDNWIVLGEKTDQDIINIIQDLNIDILIDLTGLFGNNRVNIFNTRICPLQISWLGFNHSTGLKEVDYILADKNTVKDEEKYYGSKIYKLPKIFNSHRGFEHKRYFNELPYKKNGYFTFGSLNNFMKINDEVLDVWTKILKKVKNSRIILKSSLNVCEDVIMKKFEKEGLINCVEILKKTKGNDFLSHINVYDKIDLCLDPFPFSGVTTSCEALWKNVPVVNKTGYNFITRTGESIMKNANLNNFIATSNDEYIEKAVFFANNIDELEKVRKELFDKVLETPLFDTTSFSNDFCEALENMLNSKLKNTKTDSEFFNSMNKPS